MKRLIIFIFIFGSILPALNCISGQTNFFDYKRYLLGSNYTLSLNIQSINKSNGAVVVNGTDSQAPTTPFTWKWGDGNVTNGFFPQTHSYSDLTKNYVLNVISNYSNGQKDSVQVIIKFIAAYVTPISLPPEVAVHIPSSSISISARLFSPPTNLVPFDNSFFTTLPRATLEYILSVISSIQNDFVNNNVFMYNSKFEQYLLRDSSFAGAYALWYTNPIIFGVGDVFMKGSIGYSSLFHEMGHNFTLNTPANYYYGGKVDGNANAIYSEAMAQIFQHAAGYQLINNYQFYGISQDLMMEIEQSVISSIGVIRSNYQKYLNSGKKFYSWNDPNSTIDETMGTFMTIAYKFCEQAENIGQGYKTPLKRMLSLLQGFNQSWQQMYNPSNNSAQADTFRATLMVTAMSYGFAKDLRSDFRALNFPFSDNIYNNLYSSVTSIEQSPAALPHNFELWQNYPNPFNPSTIINYSLPKNEFVTIKIYDALGREAATLVNEEKPAGNYTVKFNAGVLSNGIYFYQLRTNEFIETKKMILLK